MNKKQTKHKCTKICFDDGYEMGYNSGELQRTKDILEIIENLNPSNFRIQGAKAYQIELKQKIQALNKQEETSK